MSISVNQIRVSIAGTESKGFKIDIAGAPYQLIKAAGEGLTAALSVVKYLNEKK